MCGGLVCYVWRLGRIDGGGWEGGFGVVFFFEF